MSTLSSATQQAYDVASATSSSSGLSSATQQAYKNAMQPQDVVTAQTIQQQKPQDYNGWCESFAEKATGMGWQGASAAQAARRFSQKGKLIANPTGMQSGNLVYFHPDASNNYEGHVGIITNGDKFISATNNGIQELPISEWQKQTGQTIAGFVQPTGKLPTIN